MRARALGAWERQEPLVLAMGVRGVGGHSASSCPGFLTSFCLARAGPGFGLVSCSGSRGGSHGDPQASAGGDAPLPGPGCGPGCAWYLAAGELGALVCLSVRGCGGRPGWLRVVCRLCLCVPP